MNSLRLAFSIFFFIAPVSMISRAQSTNKGSIFATVIDSSSGKPIESAAISLYKPKAKTPFTGMTTNDKGAFALTGLPAGEYRLTIDFVGFPTKTITIAIKNSTIDLGNIPLQATQENLAAVVVRASKPVFENKIDKLVYNAAADLTSQGGMATDILQKVPMVSVDIDGNVELQGNANIRFLINGKPATIYGATIADVLQTIPASEIKSIEVITSPGAEYDAAGTAGIINIVLKDNKLRGLNGSINASAGTRLENGAVNLSARNKKLALGAFFSGNDQLNSTILNTADRLSFNIPMDTFVRYVQKRVSPFTRSGYQTGVNFDWNMTPKDELTATAGYDHLVTHATGRTAQDQLTYLSPTQTLSDITSERISATHFGENVTNASLDYKKNFKKAGNDLELLATYASSKNTNYDSELTNYLNVTNPAGGIISTNPGTDKETDLSADYHQPLSKTISIAAGAKTVIEKISNNAATDTLTTDGSFVNDNGQTYLFRFTRKIYAGYLSASFSLFHDFLNGKAGLRYEHTDNHADLQDLRVPADDIWAPDLLIQHKIDETQSVKFAYTYRIERPDYEDLNPFLEIIDPHNISTGNPLLKNETGHKFEAGYSKTFRNNNTLYVGCFYNYNDNDIQSFTTYYPVLSTPGGNYNDVSLTKSVNIGLQTTLGLNLTGTIVVSKKISLRSNIFLLSKNNKMPGQPSVGGFSYKLNANATYEISDGFLAEAFGTLNSKRTDFQNIQPGYYIYTIALKKFLLNKKASIGLTATNPFNQYIDQHSSAYGTGFTQTNLRQKTLRSVGITLSYKFGKEKTPENDNNGLLMEN